MSYSAYGSQKVEGVGTTVTSDSTYWGDGDTAFYVVVAEPGGEETDGEGFTFRRVPVGYWAATNLVVDAPAAALAQWEAEQEAKRQAAREAYAERLRAEARQAAQEPKRGRTVEVVRGRKVPVGTVAEVFWYGESKFGYRSEWRVGLLLPDGEKVFTAASNVEVVNPEQYAPEAFAA